jgi:hypothetical protein
MDVPGSSRRKKRLALLIASTPGPTGKKTKPLIADNECVVCHKSGTSKSNPLIEPNQETWNTIYLKTQSWKNLGTKFDNLFEIIQFGAAPKEIHKLCKLEIVGEKLKRAQKRNNSDSRVRDTDADTSSTNEIRARCSRMQKGSLHSACILCTENLERKVITGEIGGRTLVKHQILETEDALRTFSEDVHYVDDEQTKFRLQALVTFCNNEGGILKAAALDICYHKECWKAYCRPVYNKKASDEKKNSFGSDQSG